MKIITQKKKFALISLLVFSFVFFWWIDVNAQTSIVNCGDYTDNTTCDAVTDCEWCGLPGAVPTCHRKLETNWPPSPANTKLTRCSTLPDLIKYFYEWGLAIAGILTFFSLIVGGVFYLSSAGNPGAMKEATDRIYSAILGLLLVLGSWLILNAINPELTNFKTSPLNWEGMSFYECDIDEDYCLAHPTAKGCIATNGLGDCAAGYECIINADEFPAGIKGDGTKDGMCAKKQEEGKTTEMVALVYEGTEFSSPEEPYVALKDLAVNTPGGARSVITFYYDAENTSGDCNFNCAMCSKKDDCMNRYNNGHSCWWDGTYCLTNASKGAMGALLQLYEFGGCSGRETPTVAYDKNIERWVSYTVLCVRLINPAAE